MTSDIMQQQDLPPVSLQPGVAPIKTEYIVRKRVNDSDISEQAKLEETPAEDDDDDAECKGTTLGVCQDGNPSKPNRNKINRSSMKKNFDVEELCPNIARGEECKRSVCRFNHDLDLYLKNKPEDLGTECPNILASGKCRFGLVCRFSSSHPILPSEPKIKEPSGDDNNNDDGEEEKEKEDPLLKRIRKKEISFDATEKFLQSLKDPNYQQSYPILEGSPRRVDFSNKLYLAPLTTVGNLPFRRICKDFGVDITCGEMAMCTNILKGQASELALLRRHPSEDIFGVQICGGWTDSMTQCAELLQNQVDCDFVDVNMGCPIDLVFKKGMGSGLLDKTNRVNQIITGMRTVLTDKPLTVKLRIGIDDGKPLAPKLLPILSKCQVDAITIHGRTRQQRYTKEADWNFIGSLVDQAKPFGIPIIGNGDILSYEDYSRHVASTGVNSVMIGRGALIKPWIFTEIKEQRYWDIRSSERFDMLKKFVRYGLEHFGSDTAGVDRTRRFLLEWLSFLHRYVPVGILERLPPKINDRPPQYIGRDDLESLMASSMVSDWVKISEMLLGPVSESFIFIAKHKSNSYSNQQG